MSYYDKYKIILIENFKGNSTSFLQACLKIIAQYNKETIFSIKNYKDFSEELYGRIEKLNKNDILIDVLLCVMNIVKEIQVKIIAFRKEKNEKYNPFGHFPIILAVILDFCKENEAYLEDLDFIELVSSARVGEEKEDEAKEDKSEIDFLFSKDDIANVTLREGKKRADLISLKFKKPNLFNNFKRSIEENNDNFVFKPSEDEDARIEKAHRFYNDAKSSDLSKDVAGRILTGHLKRGQHKKVNVVDIYQIQNENLLREYNLYKASIIEKLSSKFSLSSALTLNGEKFVETSSFKFPILDDSCGEVFLFRSINMKILKEVCLSGFDPEQSRKYIKEGHETYGALGKGVYFSDSFSKVLSYLCCPKCNFETCGKSNCDTIFLAFMCRVVLGNPLFVEDRRSRRLAEDIPKEFHSAIGKAWTLKLIAKHKTVGGFGSTEFLVDKKYAIFTEFIIKFKLI